jgi:FixJ family two-component response regulator
MTAAPPVIHVVDDDAQFRRAIARLLRASGYHVALYESGRSLLETLPVKEPGCILLDVRMPGLSGPELQARLVEQGNLLPIVFLTGHGDVSTGVRAMKVGAEDFLLKPVSKALLLETVERALARYNARHRQEERLDELRALVATFTHRENQVFALVIRGKLNKQIAYELGAAERTVKSHRHRLMAKLKVQSVAEAVAIAERLGMLDSPSD